MTAKISGVDDTRHRLPIRRRLGLQAFHLGLGNQAMNRHHPSSSSGLAGKVRRKSQSVAAPLGDNRLAIGRGLANDAVGIGNQESSSQAEGHVSLLVPARAVE